MNSEPQTPTELIQLPRPSWGPAFLAFGVAIMINGVFGQGYLVRGWVYSVIGAVITLFALRSLISGAVRDFYRLPLEQPTRGAVLPAASLRPPQG